MQQSRPSRIDPAVFWPPCSFILGFRRLGTVFPESLSSISKVVLNSIIDGLRLGFVVSSAGFLIFALFLAVSRFGKIRLGQDDERPNSVPPRGSA